MDREALRDYNVRMGARLREARRQAGLTQDEVAESLGMPQGTISLIELGHRAVRLHELVAFATLYKTQPELLFEAVN
jgi:transcriptional regulator with XRE-family HTH domain